MKQPEGFSEVKMNRGSAICKKNKSNTQKTTMKVSTNCGTISE